MDKVDEKSINELQQNVDKVVDKIISDDFKIDKEQYVKFSKFLKSLVDIISKNKNLLPEKAKKIFNNIFLNLDKIKNKKFSDNTIKELKTYLKKHDYKSIGDLLEKDIYLLGGKRNKTKRNKSKRKKTKRNKSKRNKSRRNKSKRNISSKYSKLKGGVVNEDEDDTNMCRICWQQLDENNNVLGQPIDIHIGPNGQPHRAHFNCIKTWVLTRIRGNQPINCSTCDVTLNFNQLPIQLQNDPDIQQAYAAQQAQPQQQAQPEELQQILDMPDDDFEDDWADNISFLSSTFRLFWPLLLLLAIITILNTLTEQWAVGAGEQWEQINEFIRQLNNILMEYLNGI
jgi:hypothetical protein